MKTLGVKWRVVRAYALVIVLLLLAALSGLMVAYVSYENRRLNNQIQQVLENRNTAQVEWGKLLLEHSTLTSPGRIEMIAAQSLGMEVPKTKQIEIIQP